MRRLFFGLLCTLPQALFALYNGNPSAPMMPEVGALIPQDDWFGVKIGYLCDYVYDQSLRSDRSGTRDSHKKTQSYHRLGQSGSIVANFNDRVEIFANLGVMSCHITQRFLPLQTFPIAPQIISFGE